MRILLAQNSLYYPAHGGGDKSNRLLMEALAARGHACRVVARIAVSVQGGQRYLARAGGARRAARAAEVAGVRARRRGGAHCDRRQPAGAFCGPSGGVRPEIILASTDDPAQMLLETALRAPRARVVYLARATLALPFGPDCAFPGELKTDRIRAADGVVGVSRYVADYIRKYAGIDAAHVPISLIEREDWPEIGRFGNQFVTLVNPCAVKGIDIFLALADASPETAFAAVPMWGTNPRDQAALRARANVTVIEPVDDINALLARTRVLLVPSLWAEARSRMVTEAMLRGVPVMASDVGGIPEAKMGVPYLLPVNPIARYQTRLDEQMVPVAEVPPQATGPWREALGRLLEDRAHWEEISRASRAAAVEYAAGLNVGPFEEFLEDMLRRPKVQLMGRVRELPSRSVLETLSPERRRLLALRLRNRAPASAWFPGADAVEGLRLFWFPHAGGGAARALRLPHAAICPVRLPGREARIAEAPFERMEPLVAALADAIRPYLAQPFAFFGHSMGAAVAFELARLLRRRRQPLPKLLVASGARAPQFRRSYAPPPAPGDEEFLEELRRLEGTPRGVLDDPGPARRSAGPAGRCRPLSRLCLRRRRRWTAPSAPMAATTPTPASRPFTWKRGPPKPPRLSPYAVSRRHFLSFSCRPEVLASLAADLRLCW